jgi:transposase
LIAAISLDGYCYFQVFYGNSNQILVLHFLHQLIQHLGNREASAKRPFFVFWDNLRSHHSSVISKFLSSNKVPCLFNCPYSCFLNPIELLFGSVKASFKNSPVLQRYSCPFQPLVTLL